MLIGQDVVLHGDNVSFYQPDTYTSWDDVSSFSMNSIGDQGYFITRYNSYGDVFEYHSTVKGLDETYNNFQGDLFDYIDFYGDKGDFLLGYRDPYGVGLERVVCIQNYNFNYAYGWDAESMQTPEFNADHEILLFGTVKGDEYYIKGVYLGTEAWCL